MAKEQEPRSSPGTLMGTVNPSPSPHAEAASRISTCRGLIAMILGTSDQRNAAADFWQAASIDGQLPALGRVERAEQRNVLQQFIGNGFGEHR